MSEHPTHVEGWNGTLADLVTAIGKMRYDEQARFIDLLAVELKRQAVADREGERFKLAARLDQVAGDLHAAQFGMQAAWKICEPHM